MPERKRLPSTPDYYPTIKELLAADDDELKGFISRQKKTSLECLLRETLSQLGTALSAKEARKQEQLDSISETLKEVKDQLQKPAIPEMNEAVLTTLSEVKEGLTQTLNIKNDEWQTSFREVKAEIAKSRKDVSTFTKKQEDKVKKDKLSAQTEHIQYQLRIDGIPEATKDGVDNPLIKQESDKLETVLDFLEEKPEIENIRRLGKLDAKRERPRTILVTLKSIWDVRKILAKSGALRKFETWKVYLSPSLNAKDQELERRILKKRREILNKPEFVRNQSRVKISNLKLFVDGVEVKDLNCEETQPQA